MAAKRVHHQRANQVAFADKRPGLAAPRRRRGGLGWPGRASWRVLVLAAVSVLAGACNEIDTARDAPPKATLGDDIYGMLCDRLGASSFNEDLTGASYHAICHFDEKGVYGNAVDVSVLPPVEGELAVDERALSVAKLERMATRRAELIRAFNVALPDIDIPDPTTADPGDTVRLHDALLRFSQDITVLYESNPFDEAGQPIMPMATDSFGLLFGALEGSDDARAALSRMAGRQGYRPSAVGMGGIRTLLSYPQMRPFVQAQMDVLGPDGAAVAQLQDVLRVAKRELRSSTPTLSPLPQLVVDPASAQPNRPRFALEVLRELLLDNNAAYANPGEAPRYLTQRDRRGFVVPAGNVPGVAGTVATPFYDGDNDGFADVDLLGRFIAQDGTALALDTPFAIPGLPTTGPVDAYGRPEAGLYNYVDTTQTALRAVARDMVPLMDATRYASDDDPAPWLSEHETMMYALAGMQILAGPRQDAVYDHYTEKVFPAGTACPAPPADVSAEEAVPCTSYSRFVAEESPLPDLAHATGQLLAHPDSDAILLGVLELIEEHEDVMARVLGAALKIKAVADAHDQLAAQGNEPKAELDYSVPVWDEMGQVLNEMLKHPGLMADLLRAMADPVMVQSHPQDPLITGAPAQHMGETLAAFMKHRDHYGYNRNNVNGPAINATDGYPSFANPHNPVDRNQPLTGTNRSMFERSLQLIYDGKGVLACNKQGAKVYTGLLNTYWPLIGSYDECELFTFQNVGAFYLDAQLPSNHPKRAELIIKPGVLEGLLNFIGVFTSKDAFMEDASGITGMTLHPTPPALNRLMFYGALSEQFGVLPDYDSQNAGSNTDKFVGASIEPLGGLVCPLNGNGVPHCSQQDDVLRMRDRDVIFGWERLGFYQYLRPQLRVFAELSCNAQVTACDTSDLTGEGFFLELMSTLWRHWPGPDHGSYCSSAVNPSDNRYCSSAGINRYEPILSEALGGDIMPAMHEFAKVAASVNITIERGPKQGQVINGADIVELLVRIMFDQQWAQTAGVADRAGNTNSTWVDGTPQAQVTVFQLFADALHRMDVMFETSNEPDVAERRAKWKRARSQLVDQFLLVEGEGATAKFSNAGAPKLMAKGIRLLREQLNANCPDRESSGQCNWAKVELGQKLNDTMSRPIFATVADLANRLNADDPARRELQRFVSYAMASDSGADALSGMLASMGDMMQLLRADNDFAPIFRAVATAANPSDDPDGAGCVDRTVQVLKAMSDDRYDRYHVLDYVLPALVTPIDDGQGLTPIEIAADAIADVNRIDANESSPLQPQDYLFVMKTLREFMTSDTRGFQQLYYIVQNRPKE